MAEDDRGLVIGNAWTDHNNAPGGCNGCDTRNGILCRDLTKLVVKAGSIG